MKEVTLLNVVVLSLIALSSSMQGGQDQQPAVVSAAASRETNTVRDEAVRNLASEPPEVAQTYEMLVPQSRKEHLRTYGSLPSSMKAAVWIHQFRVALAEHPEFTAEQRDVLKDAIDLVTPDMFEISNLSSEWSSRVDRPLQEITTRAKVAFGVVLASQLFAHLGPINDSHTRSEALTQSLTKRAVPNDDLPQCMCSTVSDYCASEFGPYHCEGGGCYWGMNWGCGSLEDYRCNGLCAPNT